MTNLSFNDNRAIAMDDRQMNSSLNAAKKAQILAKIKPVFFQHFEQLVDDCCARIDVEFGLQLKKNREKTSKDQYIKFVEYLRSVREEIKQNYWFKVDEIFDSSYQKTAHKQSEQVDFSKISLSSDDMVKENYAITRIIRQCEHLFYEELIQLNGLFAIQRGTQTIVGSQNPIFPEKLVRALVEVVSPLKLNADGRIALYKTFEACVFSQLGFVYRELIKSAEIAAQGKGAALGDAGQSRVRRGASPTQLYVVNEITERVEPTPTSSEQPSAEFGLLQKKLELWRLAHFPSDYDVISAEGSAFYEHFEIINALKVLQQFRDDLAPSDNERPLKWRALKKMEELSFSIDVKILAKQDEDVLDLVALIFREIAKNELLQGSARMMVLQLEIPFAIAAIGRYSVFTERDNPVRRLLDKVFAAGMFLSESEDDRLLRERILSAVQRISKDGEVDLSGWIAEASEFSRYMDKQKQLCRDSEENAIWSILNKQTSDLSDKVVVLAVENCMKGKRLPTLIVEFLRNVWSKVLQDAYASKDEQPELWEKKVQAMDELVASVMTPVDDQHRKQILKLLPGMIVELRDGLKKISYDKSAQSRFFKELAVWHIILMDKKGKADDAASESGNIKTDATAQVENLVEDSWLAFISASGRQWGKLAWKDVATANMLFVGKSGVKVAELQKEALAEQLRLGQAVVVNVPEQTITERVLTKLMNL